MVEERDQIVIKINLTVVAILLSKSSRTSNVPDLQAGEYVSSNSNFIPTIISFPEIQEKVGHDQRNLCFSKATKT
jgi:hypothetical protein